MVSAWPSAECSDSIFANSAQPRGSLCLWVWRIGASAYLAAADTMPSSMNILPVSAAIAFIASRLRGIGRRAPAAAGGGHREAALREIHPDMQRGIGAHRMADDMRPVDLQRIHHADHVVARDVLRIHFRLFGNVGRRIAALAVGDAAMRARELAQLRLPGAIVCRIFVDEDDRRAAPGFLIIELDAVFHRQMRHAFSPASRWITMALK